MNSEKRTAAAVEIDTQIAWLSRTLEQAGAHAATYHALIAHVRAIYGGANTREFAELLWLHDFHGFTLAALNDLYSNAKALLQAKVPMETLYFVRHGFLVVFEALDTYDQHSRRIREVVEQYDPAIKASFLTLAGRVKTFRRRAGGRDQMKELRRSIVVHIKPGFHEYWQQLKGIDVTQQVQLLIEFRDLLEAIQLFLSNFLKQANQQWQAEIAASKSRVETTMSKIEGLFERARNQGRT